MGNSTSFDPVDVWQTPQDAGGGDREWSLESDEQSTGVANGVDGISSSASRDGDPGHQLRTMKTFAMPGESSGAGTELLASSDSTEVFVSLANDDEKRAVIEPPYDQVLYKIVFRHAGFSWAIFRLPSELWTLNMNMYVFHPAQSNDLPYLAWMQVLGLSSKSRDPTVDIVVDSRAGGWKPTLEGVKEGDEEEDAAVDESANSELNEFSLDIPRSAVAEDRMSFHSVDGEITPDGRKRSGSASSGMKRIQRRQGSVMPDDGPRRQTELCRSIATWLTAAANNHKLRRSDAFSLFAEVSAVSFERDGQHKRIESYGYKRRGGRQYMRRYGCSTTMKRVTRLHWLKPYTKRWFVLRDDYLLYTASRTVNKPMDVVLFDSRFQVLSKNEDPSLHKYSLRIVNSYRSLTVKFQNRRQCLSWKSSLEQAYEECQWNTQYRFSAFAPPRDGCNARVLVDGREHMSQVMACIGLAQDEVFISGWWITPDLPLTRPCTEGCLLVDVLKKKADEGVKIFVVVYQEISLALYNNSLHTKKVLEEASPNIHVVTHPIQFGARAVWYWSHHQKLVIVDHCIAFVGGIDLCLGRFDSYEHRLCDRSKDKSKRIFPGKDYTNPCIKDFVNVQDIFDTDSEASESEEESDHNSRGHSPDGDSSGYPSSREKGERHKSRPLLDRNSQPRMPWHDTSVQIVGPVVSDIARHFVQLWNHIKTDKHKQQDKVQYLQVTGEERSKHERTARLKKNLKGKLKRIQEFDVRKRLGGADLLQLNRAKAISQEHEIAPDVEVPEPQGDVPPESPVGANQGGLGPVEGGAGPTAAVVGHHRPPRHDNYGAHVKAPSKEQGGRPALARGNTTGMAISLDVLKQIEQVSAPSAGPRGRNAHFADISPRKKNLSDKPRFFGRARTHIPPRRADAPVPQARGIEEPAPPPGARRMTFDVSQPAEGGPRERFAIQRSFTMDGSTSPMYIGDHKKAENTPIGLSLDPEVIGPRRTSGDGDDDGEEDSSSGASSSDRERSPRHRKHRKASKDTPQPGPSLYGRGRSISGGGSPAAATSRLLRPEATTALTIPMPRGEEQQQKERKMSIHRQDSLLGTFWQRIQFLRSCSWWSMGLPTENSIYQAYINTIADAERYIYIENQFFVTTTDAKDPSCAEYGYPVKNEIGKAIADRVFKAITENDRKFRVYVLLPLLPAFEGENLWTADAFVCRITIHLQMRSIHSVKTSIIQTLKRRLIAYHKQQSLQALQGKDVSTRDRLEKAVEEVIRSHIGFFCLRTVSDGFKDGKLRTEQIYIHAKTMIVDDTKAIIGSANINDRSMSGDRDSETAVLIEDDIGHSSPYTFAGDMRTQLWREHFGLLQGVLEDRQEKTFIDNVLRDPTSDSCWKMWLETAERNIGILREGFHGVWPDSEIRNWKQFHEVLESRSNPGGKEKQRVVDGLKGSRVFPYPLEFLCEEDMTSPAPTSISLMPKEIFT